MGNYFNEVVDRAIEDLYYCCDNDKAKAAAIHEAQRKSREVLDGHRLTRMEAETTPEALKVKRARAQAAYNENRNDMAPKQLYDIKVK